MAAFRSVADRAAKRVRISTSKLRRLSWCRKKGPRGPVRLEPGLQANPEKGDEHDIEVEVQFGLRPGLAMVEAQVLPSIAKGKLYFETDTMAPKDAFRHQFQVGAVMRSMVTCRKLGWRACPPAYRLAMPSYPPPANRSIFVQIPLSTLHSGINGTQALRHQVVVG